MLHPPSVDCIGAFQAFGVSVAYHLRSQAKRLPEVYSKVGFLIQLTAAATSRLFGRGFRNRSLDLWTFCIPISFRSTGARRKSSLWPPSISASVHQLDNYCLLRNWDYRSTLQCRKWTQ
ncbi:uncharacterized protein [Drosophila suzukii]|uniref:Uncharacterized protein isoform X2 n=1 Tax=Drosophila suzukii TaxID=28584 RepID=A0ABM4TR55_DROSZ